MVGSRSAWPSLAVGCLCLVSLAPILTACGKDISPDTESARAASVEAERPETSAGHPLESERLLRGHLVIGHEVRSFKLCDSEQELWVVDETAGELARVYAELTSEVYKELYAVVLGEVGLGPSDGFGADYDGSITVASLRHAAPESHACGEELSGVEIRAFGNEPFWRVDIRSEGILLSELGVEDRLFTSTPVSSGDGALLRYSGTAEAGSGQEAGAAIAVAIEERTCRDSMSGAYFSFVARIAVDGRNLAGCARQGW